MFNDPKIIDPILISLKIASISSIITFFLGIALARLFTKSNFKGKDFLDSVIILPMVLPPSVIGYLLLVTIGKNGPIGKIFMNLTGDSLVFTWVAGCIACVIVSLPLMYQNAKSAFLSIDPLYEKTARNLGASKRRILFSITFPLAFPGLLGGFILSFARALGEFGATLMVCGNIPGKTQTIPTAIYVAVESSDQKTANTLMLIVVIFSLTLVYFLNKWLKRKSLSLGN